MITISLCMIVKNEEKTLSTCLQSIADIVDEIIIIDTGSTDQTKEIAKHYTNHIYDFEWTDDFSAARNYSFEHATKEYILWLDADDILLPEDQHKLLQLKQTIDPTIDAISMKYNTAFDSYQNVIASTQRLRLLKRTKAFTWVGIVHEDLTLNTTYRHQSSDIVITHTNQRKTRSRRNLNIYEKSIRNGHKLSVQDLFHYARELTVHKMYTKAIEVYEKCLTCTDISLENRVFIYHQLATCYYCTGHSEKEQELTLRSFEMDIPQPVFCCRMGESFLNKQQYEQAAFWYKLAIEIDVPARYAWSVEQHIFRTWLPHKQLGICYYHLRAYQDSYDHNKMVLTYQPDDQEALTNLRMLETLLSTDTSS